MADTTKHKQLDPATGYQPALRMDPMLEAALIRLADRGPRWQEAEADLWGQLFLSTVMLVYPAHQPRKSRAKSPQQPLL